MNTAVALIVPLIPYIYIYGTKLWKVIFLGNKLTNFVIRLIWNNGTNRKIPGEQGNFDPLGGPRRFFLSFSLVHFSHCWMFSVHVISKTVSLFLGLLKWLFQLQRKILCMESSLYETRPWHHRCILAWFRF